MRKTALFSVLVVAGFLVGTGEASADQIKNHNFTQPPPKEGYSYPDCYCTDSKGQRVDMGKTACLIIGSRRVLARCDMSVNNPTWRHESEGCPSV